MDPNVFKIHSIECYESISKIDCQHLTPKKVQAEKPINTCTGWEHMTQNWEIHTFLVYCHHFVQCNARNKFNTASGCHLETLGRKTWIVSEGG